MYTTNHPSKTTDPASQYATSSLVQAPTSTPPAQQEQTNLEPPQGLSSTSSSKATSSSTPASQPSRPVMSGSSKSSVRSANSSFPVDSPGGSNDQSSRSLLEEHRRSSIGQMMDKAKAKLSGSERLPNDEREYQRMQAKEIEKQRRREDYERLGLEERTKFGTPGAGAWHA